MDKILKLKAKMTENATALQAILDAVPEGQSLSDEQQTKFDALIADNKSVEKQISNLEAAEVAKKTAENMANRPVPVVPNRPSASAPGEVPASRIEQVIPANVRRGNKLNAFKDEPTAYRFGKWVLACRGVTSAQEWCRNNGIPLATVHQEGVNSTGGYLVPQEFDSTLVDLRLQYGVFRQNVAIKQMTSDTLMIPRRATGLTGYWVGEGSTITESNKTWGQVQLTAKTLAAITRMSVELSEDAVISIGDDLAGEVAYIFAYNEDLAGFVGTGISTHGGIIGVSTALKAAAGTPTTTSAGGVIVGAGNLLSELTLANHNSVVGVCPSYARAGAKWYCSPTYQETVMNRLAYAAGGATTTEINNGVVVQKFLGYPVVLTEVLPSTDANSQICCLFGNLGMAAKLGDRRQTTIAFSDSATVGGESVFEKNQIAVRGTERLDIVVHDVGNTSSAGPIVGLQSLNA